ncbi:MAG: ABC transporter substrate-binding protein [Alphaproteobacteria bacterium]|nr:MAG: ABC transporter substrate-binding protein [Alphaproteobacteria bacterium]
MTSVRLLAGGAAQPLVERVRRGLGFAVDGTFSAVGAMRDKLVAGEPADLVILSRVLVEQLAQSGHVAAASMADVARVATAVAVRSADPLPAIADKAGLAAALEAADEIHFPDPAQATAGIHFAKVMRDLGVWNRVESRLRRAPNGNTAMRALAASTARRPIGCTQETEIRATPGIVLAGPLPPGCDLTTVYTAAITSRARAPAEAAAFIARARS